MKKVLTFVLAMFSFSFSLNATNYYAAPNGTGDGTSYESPTTWSAALGALHSGDSLFLLGGTYSFTAKQEIGSSKAGTEDARTFIGAYPGEKPVFDFRNQPYGKEENDDHDNTGISIGGNYIHLKGIELCYTGKSGLVNGGSFCLFENLDVHGCGDTGIQMKAGNNTILNCDSHDNFDYKLGGTASPDYGGNADGFADKKYAEAPGNHYIGCRAWNNSDDGWDFYERKSTSETIIENCICYANGPATYNMSGHPRYNKDKEWFDESGEDLAHYTNYGNGNGFKLGGNDEGHEYEHNVTVHHCLSVGHPAGKKGFDRNNNAGVMNLYNNTAYDNGINYGFPQSSKTSKGTLNIQNCISFESKGDNNFYIAETNDHNTWNSGFTVSSSDFQSLDESLILAARNADGSLPENAFMRLAATSELIDAGEDVGYAFKGEAPDLGCYEAASSKPTPVAATFAWEVGNEKTATVTSEKDNCVSETKVSTGSDLAIATISTYDANPGNTMVKYQPGTSNAGSVASVMIEYSVKMKKGTTFKLKKVTYDAVKDGTDNATYSWSYAVDGVAGDTTTVPKELLLRNNKKNASTASLNHSETITAAVGQEVKVRFFVSGFANDKKFALSNIQLIGTISGEPEGRAFTDFKVEFRDNPRTVILPESGELPTGVTIEGTSYNGGQHGIYGGTITVPVDGPVKFTIGACQHSKTDITIKKDGVLYTTISNNAPCGEVKPNYNQNVTWTYNVEEAATLTFEFGSQTYVPYFFAEACEYVPQLTVRYYDIDGKTLIGEEVVDGSSALAYKYGAGDVTIADGKTFRGWFDSTNPTAKKIKEGTILTEDLSLYAQVRDIEVAKVGSVFEYDFRPASFDPEEHDILTFTKASYNGSQHGWAFSNGGTMSIEVAGNALLVVGVCKYSHTGDTEVRDAADNVIGTLTTENNVTPDGELQRIKYTGEATTLTFHFTATDYIHTLKVYNVAAMPAKNDAGYYEIAAGDAAAFLLTLESAEAGDKIFLPNGEYDLGERVLTPISVNNLSIIGESMEGTIIRNAPEYHTQSIDNTATLKITNGVSGTYLQDLTLRNDLEYYKAIADPSLDGGKGIALQDQGTQTICKNVKLLSHQDTYYNNYEGSVGYFEDCEIYGTVDYICGCGSLYFKNNLLYNRQRYEGKRSGSDAITANNGSKNISEKGFVFEGCTIKSECDMVSLGRAWNNTPKVTFLNSIVDYSEGEFSFENSSIQRWTKQLMNPNAWPEFGEYNTRTTGDVLLTPSSNVVTFINKGSSDTRNIETVLTAEQAAVFTMEYTLGSWAATAKEDVAQATADQNALVADAAYLIENEGEFVEIVKGANLAAAIGSYTGKTMRQANSRGAFGAPVKITDTATAIEEMTESTNTGVVKFIKDGQLVLKYKGVLYNVQGQVVGK